MLTLSRYAAQRAQQCGTQVTLCTTLRGRCVLGRHRSHSCQTIILAPLSQNRSAGGVCSHFEAGHWRQRASQQRSGSRRRKSLVSARGCPGGAAGACCCEDPYLSCLSLRGFRPPSCPAATPWYLVSSDRCCQESISQPPQRLLSLCSWQPLGCNRPSKRCHSAGAGCQYAAAKGVRQSSVPQGELCDVQQQQVLTAAVSLHLRCRRTTPQLPDLPCHL
jgi:hypothetical protein